MADRYEEIARKITRHLSDASKEGYARFTAAWLPIAISDALREQDRWFAMDDPEHPAPRDGMPVLIELKNPIPNTREDLRAWDGVAFVARNRGDAMEWCFAAPVGHGGFPDEWIAHYRPLPAPPLSGRKPGPFTAGEPRG